MSNNKEIIEIKTLEDLIFNINTDRTDYFVYVYSDADGSLKLSYKKPKEQNKAISIYIKKAIEIYDEEKVNAFIEKMNLTELVDVYNNIFKDITKNAISTKLYREIHLEFYSDSKFLGEAKAYALFLHSVSTPYSGVKWQGRRAIAIGYTWLERMKAKYPEYAVWAYKHVEYGKKDKAWFKIHVKIPVVTDEFRTLWNMIFFGIPKKKEKEISEETKEKLLPEWLWKGYLVAFTLPSEWLNAKYTWNVDESSISEHRITTKQKYYSLSAFRARFMQYLASVAVKTTLGWVLAEYNDDVKERLAKFMEDLDNLLTNLGINDYPIKPIRIVEVYIPKNVISELVKEYIEEYKAKMDMVIKKLEKILKEKEELEKIVHDQAKRHGRASQDLLDDLKKLEKSTKLATRTLKNIRKRLEVAKKLLNAIGEEEKEISTIISQRVKALEKVIS